MSATEILSMVKNKVKSITGRYGLGLSGQLIDQVGGGRLVSTVGTGALVSNAKSRVITARRRMAVPMIFGEITTTPSVEAAIEGFPAKRYEGRAVSHYSDSAVYVE